MNTTWVAEWIWCANAGLHDYNQTVLFKKEFDFGGMGEATLRITADSWYRVFINGTWVHDGPAKAYPSHFLFDTFEVGELLKPGRNKIDVIVRYYGVGTFHQLPLQAGLWAQLDTEATSIGTDSSWLASPSFAWKQWTPKISPQMEPVEEYDARRDELFDWKSAVYVNRSGKLSPRPVGLLTKIPRKFEKLSSATVVKRAKEQVCVPLTLIAQPGLIEANGYTSRPVLLGSVLTVDEEQEFDFSPGPKKEDFVNRGEVNWQISVDGQMVESGWVTLSPGDHFVLFACTSFYGHEKDASFPYLNRNKGNWGPWQVAVLDEFIFYDSDRVWFVFEHAEAIQMKVGYLKRIKELSCICKSMDAFSKELSGWILKISEERLFMVDPATEFFLREPLFSAESLLDGKVIQPSPEGDVELCFDLGEQSCGYFDFQIKACEGVTVDLNAVEYIMEDGTIQHTLPFNRNGMRYTTKEGINRFTSVKRRSGQYLFVTLRNQQAPLEIKHLRIVESTAAVKAEGSFESSDPLLNRIWKMSERTLQLCMEDTFTDCPLYEQTLWIGDARNEALYAFTAYANFDVSARSLELGAQSLEYFPIVGCQVPSAWDCLLPAWSFLWGMHVWEHYFYSGDLGFLEEIWPAVQRNIDGAFKMLDQSGIFSGTFWNLIEWAPVDEDHATVLHNSMLLVGALRAAENCAKILNDETVRNEMVVRREKLISSINKVWDDKKNAYPDSIYADGTPSPKTCQQTSMLSVMCGLVPEGKKEALRENLLNPPKNMTRVCSPFAMQFMYEALEELDEMDAVLASMRTNFKPMFDANASTVWETFPDSNLDTYGFPTRSHCHAWASSPIYFLNRLVLGIRQTGVGGAAFEISPWLADLRYARGTTATPRGSVSVDWKVKGKTLQLVITTPEHVEVNFKSNASHDGLSVEVVYLSTEMQTNTPASKEDLRVGCLV